MEVCICTLLDLRKYVLNMNVNYDVLCSKILLILMKKVNRILEYNIFHGDIKPSNIAVTVRDSDIDLILLDFGASSWDYSDYYNFYTPQFTNPQIYSKVTNGFILNID